MGLSNSTHHLNSIQPFTSDINNMKIASDNMKVASDSVSDDSDTTYSADASIEQSLTLDERKMIAEKRLQYLQKNENKQIYTINDESHKIGNKSQNKRIHLKRTVDDDKKHESYVRDLLN
jgi:hypothetical protein